MTKLEHLIKAHGQQGGTIHQFNQEYNVDYNVMAWDDFVNFMVTKFPQYSVKYLSLDHGQFQYAMSNINGD